MKYIKLFENWIQDDYLLESKNSAKIAYLDRGLISNELFDEFLSFDASPTKKFIDSMCKFYVAGSSSEEIIETFQKAIPMFAKNIIKVDINSLRTLNELQELLKEKSTYKTRSSIREEAKDGAKIVYEDDSWTVYLIETESAAVKYGKGTKWCISAKKDNMFQTYYHDNEETIYFVISKIKPSSDPMYKVAVVVETAKHKPVGWDSSDNAFNDPALGIVMSGERYIVEDLGLDDSIFKYIPYEMRSHKEIVDVSLDKIIKGSYSINSNGEIYVEGDVNLFNLNLRSIPFKFGKVTGDFIICANKLTNLKNSPKWVGGDFDAWKNKLITLDGGPVYVGGAYRIYSNQLSSLDGMPKLYGGSYCSIAYNKVDFPSDEPFKHTLFKPGDNISIHFGKNEIDSYTVPDKNSENFNKKVKEYLEEIDSKNTVSNYYPMLNTKIYNNYDHLVVNKRIIKNEEVSEFLSYLVHDKDHVMNNKTDVKELDFVFDITKNYKTPVVLYRGLYEEEERDFIVDKFFNFYRYSSFSENIEVARSFSTSKDILKINSSVKGFCYHSFLTKVFTDLKNIDFDEFESQDGQEMLDTADEEKEWIFNIDTKFKVTKIYNDGGFRIIEGDLI